MVSKVIIGAGYGDEGKGTIIATFAKNSQGPILNVLTNGGAQRAHSIITDKGSFTFQHFGSGSYYRADNYFSRFFILNPMQFKKEYDEHSSKGLVFGNLYRSSFCKWSTPWDMMANAITSKGDTCGMGIWNTIVRYNNTITISIDEFVHLDNPREYLIGVRNYYSYLDIPKEYQDAWYGDGLIDHFIKDCKFLVEKTICSEDIYLNPKYTEALYENGQGLLLSDTGKNIEGTTPSLTGATYAQLLNPNVELHYVTRPYLTRHGRAGMEGINRNLISSSIQEDRTNHYNEFQGEFKFNYLNIDNLKQRILDDSKGSIFTLHVTHCDEMDRTSEFQRVFNNLVNYDSPLIK